MADDKQLSTLNGVQRAAVLLMAVGSDKAAEVLKHMTPKEVQAIGAAMATMQNIHRDSMVRVMDEFIEKVGNQTAMGVGSEDYIRQMMVNALGEDKAKGMIDRILVGKNAKGLETLKWMDARSVAEIIRLEHPQIIAIVLSYLDPDQAANVVSLLPERARPDIMMRVAALEAIPPAALTELNAIMEKQFIGTTNNVAQSAMGGFRTAANIINFMDSSVSSAIMSAIQNHDNEMSEGIQDLMFVFDNLMDVDDRGIQALLREVSSDNLTLALKAADERIKEKILKNMSKRAAEMLKEDMEVRGPVKLTDVEAAQKEILAVARRLADSGEIVLGGGAEQMV